MIKDFRMLWLVALTFLIFFNQSCLDVAHAQTETDDQNGPKVVFGSMPIESGVQSPQSAVAQPSSLQTQTSTAEDTCVTGNFSWSNAFITHPTAYVSSTEASYYFISLYNVPVGDALTWNMYNPILDPETYLPTGDYSSTPWGWGIWTRDTDTTWFGVADDGSESVSFGDCNHTLGAGPAIFGNSAATRYPGPWKITISYLGQILTTGFFTLVDDKSPSLILFGGGGTLIGKVSPWVLYGDNVAVIKLELYVDSLDTGESVLLYEYINPNSQNDDISWDTTNFPNGDYIYRPVVHDPFGNTSFIDHDVTIANGIPPGFPEETLAPAESRSLTKDPINIATGEAYFNTTDILLSGLGPELSLSRKYRSFSTYSGLFGFGWRSDYDINLTEDASGNVTIIDADGRGIYFMHPSETAYVHSPGSYATLTRVDGKGQSYTLTLTDKNGNVTEFDNNGRLSTRTDRNGNTLSFVLDGATGYIQDSSGRRIDLFLNSDGRITSAMDPAGKIFYYDYDQDGNLVSVTDPEGNIATYEYDSNHKIVLMTNPNGHNTYFEYDTQGRAITNWQDNDVNKISLNYLGNNTTEATDSLGNLNTYVFNDVGLQVSHTDPLGHVTQQTWSYAMNLTSRTDARNNRTAFKYDQKGNLLRITDPQGNEANLTYTPEFNLISTETDALGQVTSFAYDNKGNLVTITDTLGNDQTFLYDQYGNIIKSTDSRGNSTDFTYDALNHVIQKIDALGNKNEFTYE